MHFLTLAHNKLVNQLHNIIRKQLVYKCRYYCSESKAGEVEVQLLNG